MNASLPSASSSSFPDCFALLDDRLATPGRPASRLYLDFVREHRCTDPTALDAMWWEVEADLRAGLHAVLLIDYEWGARLLRAGHEGLDPADSTALRVLMFGTLSHLTDAQAGAWLAEREGSEARAPAGVMNLVPSVARDDFMQAIARIHDAIAAGETYQVNYTFRLAGTAYGTPVALYRRLRARQPVAYGALIALPGDEDGATRHVLSCSPELFLRHEGGLLTARPMKGTASRVSDAQGPEGDSEMARHLAHDTKNRAENVMIVDLLRNDLGRLAETGSVQVCELFAVEPYRTVFQMTSTVQARLRPELGFADVLRGAFPCGSITGAPKHHTMQLIAGLESTPRGLYCGAIGWMDAPRVGTRVGDFCLSVAIRTLTLGREAEGLRPARLGIGAGIVADSRADDEFDECHWKARFLTGLDPGFQLFETMRGESPAPGAVPAIALLPRHLVRLGASAQALGFRFDAAAAEALLAQQLAVLAPDAIWRLRLALAHDGTLALQHAPLAALPAREAILRLADARLPAANPLAAHKTTVRAVYDEAVRAAEREGAFDAILLRADGLVVEGGRTSLFVRLAGRWFTPPVADGALPGVLRATLLDDPSFGARERSLVLDDLLSAEQLLVCNALRGALPARLRLPAPVDNPG